MLVKFLLPSELDAVVHSVSPDVVAIEPVFYRPKGPATIGIFQVLDNRGKPVDRVVMSVSGNGRLSLMHCNSVVVPAADQSNGGTDEHEDADSRGK